MTKYNSILVISDMHKPYGHKDTLPFLKAIKKKYKPDRVVCIGDEVDYHAMSFHDSDPDLDSAGKELIKAVAQMQGVFTLFPKCDVLESNHGSLPYRKAKHHGLPRHLLRTYKDVLEAPKDWRWHMELVLNTPTGKVLFKHQGSVNSLKEAQVRGLSFVQGHHHTQADIRYYHNDQGQYIFGMTVGCLIDDKSYAYAYNKLFKLRPFMAVGIIEGGIPKILPMFLKPNGRWNKVVP